MADPISGVPSAAGSNKAANAIPHLPETAGPIVQAAADGAKAAAIGARDAAIAEARSIGDQFSKSPTRTVAAAAYGAFTGAITAPFFPLSAPAGALIGVRLLGPSA